MGKYISNGIFPKQHFTCGVYVKWLFVYNFDTTISIDRSGFLYTILIERPAELSTRTSGLSTNLQTG